MRARDLAASVSAELDTISRVDQLVLAAAAGVLLRLALSALTASAWRDGFRRGQDAAAIARRVAESAAAAER